jgi:hypothetical protein
VRQRSLWINSNQPDSRINHPAHSIFSDAESGIENETK